MKPAQQRWAAATGIFFLVVGMVLYLNSPPRDEVTTFPAQNNCSAFFREGKILSWQIRNYGKPGNAGILKIEKVDSTTGEWVGEQITETKNGIRIRVTGTSSGFTMSLLHPSGVETWFGICKSREIEGSIQTTYESLLSFEMR